MRSRAKGVAFEGEVARAYEAAGFEVRGLESGGDHLVIGAAGYLLHSEVKRQERLRIPEWLAQQTGDCPSGSRRVLVFRQSPEPFQPGRTWAVVPFGQFLDDQRRLAGCERLL